MDTNQILLASSLILWCIIHSVMIDNKIINIIENILDSNFRFYRMFHNIFSTITLLIIILFAYSIPNVLIFRWDGYLIIIQALLIVIGVFFIAAGSKNYNFLQLAGIQQILNKSVHKSKSGKLWTGGILKVTRHPWYLAVLILLWARELNSTSIIINIIFSIYLVVGTYLEEQKLKIEFGETYVEYQKEVSMLFPIKWLKSIFKNR